MLPRHEASLRLAATAGGKAQSCLASGRCMPGQRLRALEAARVSCERRAPRHPAAGWSVRTLSLRLPTPPRSMLASLLRPLGGDGESASSLLHWQTTALPQLVGPVTTLR
jgi:hypothetical protein